MDKQEVEEITNKTYQIMIDTEMATSHILEIIEDQLSPYESTDMDRSRTQSDLQSIISATILQVIRKYI